MGKEKDKVSELMKDDSEKVTDKGTVKKVAILAKGAAKLAKKIEAMEAELKDLKKEREKVLREDIPNAMRQAGIDSFDTGGLRVVLQLKVQCHISVANQEGAFAWLKLHKYDSIVKSAVTVDVGDATEAQLTTLENLCKRQKFEHTHKSAVNANTLRAFIKALRDQRSESPKPQLKKLNPPADLFGIFEYTEAKITQK